MFCWWQDCPPTLEGPCRDRLPFSPCANGPRTSASPKVYRTLSTTQKTSSPKITNSITTETVLEETTNFFSGLTQDDNSVTTAHVQIPKKVDWDECGRFTRWHVIRRLKKRLSDWLLVFAGDANVDLRKQTKQSLLGFETLSETVANLENKVRSAQRTEWKNNIVIEGIPSCDELLIQGIQEFFNVEIELTVKILEAWRMKSLVVVKLKEKMLDVAAIQETKLKEKEVIEVGNDIVFNSGNNNNSNISKEYAIGASLPHDTGNCVECICGAGAQVTCSPHQCGPPGDDIADYRPPGPRPPLTDTF
ncbi:hypothetical protein FQA39_LY11569 [Lamprigera yunnana]|nr:hypothetical protein FQA39_LY11569 [Lamprigera yunnana]